jgi:hypothetical protein
MNRDDLFPLRTDRERAAEYLRPRGARPARKPRRRPTGCSPNRNTRPGGGFRYARIRIRTTCSPISSTRSALWSPSAGGRITGPGAVSMGPPKEVCPVKGPGHSTTAAMQVDNPNPSRTTPPRGRCWDAESWRYGFGLGFRDALRLAAREIDDPAARAVLDRLADQYYLAG